MANTTGVNVPIHATIDIDEASRSAEALGKKISDALNQNKDTTSSRMAKVVQDLEAIKIRFDSVRDAMEQNAAHYASLQNSARGLAAAEHDARVEMQAYEQDLIQSNTQMANLVKRMREYGYDEAKVRAGYFGKNKIEAGSDVDEQIKIIKELHDAWREASTALNYYTVMLNNMDNGATEEQAQELQQLANKAHVLLLKINELNNGMEKFGDKGTKASSNFKSNFYFVRTILNDVGRTINKISTGLENCVKKLIHLKKESHKSTTSLKDGFKNALKNILRYGLGIRSLFFLFRRLRNYAKEALQEMAKEFPAVNNQVSRSISAFNQMKGAIGTAVQPLLNVLVPALEKVAAVIVKVANLIGSVFALLTGQKTVYQAVAVQTDYAASLAQTGKNAKDAKKELEGYLSPLDEINKYNSKKDNEPDLGGGGGADLGGGLKFEEAPISDFAKKIVDTMNKILAPIKKAWANVGEYVKKSWTKAFQNIKKLISDIGRDFLEVWNQPATVKMFEYLMKALGNIGKFVANIAKAFDDAWNRAGVGRRILEGIRDICLIISYFVDKITDSWAKWAEDINFTPFLESVDAWLDSLREPVAYLSAIFKDINEQLLQPLAKWAVEVGGPKLVQVFTDFNNNVDWAGLRESLAKLWEHLEPFAERVGEGLILFIEDVMDRIAEFVNSGDFDKLIDNINAFVDSITAEDVKDTIWGIVNAIIALKAAGAVVTILLGIAKAIAAIMFVVQNFTAILAALKIIGGVTMIISGAIMAVKEFFDMWKNGWDWLSTILEAIGIALATVGAIILGAPAAVAAAVGGIIFAISQVAIIIHEHWDEIVAFFKTVWEKISGFFKSLWDSIVAIWNNVAAWFSAHVIEPVASFFQGLCERIGQFFEGIWIFIKAVWIVVSEWFDTYVIAPLKAIWSKIAGWFNEKVIAPLQNYWNIFKNFIISLWNSVVDKIKSIFTPIINFFKTKIIEPVKNAWKMCTDAIAGFFTKLWDGIVSGVKKAINTVIGAVESAINGIIGGINWFIDKFNGVVSWAASITGNDWSGISSVSLVSFPRLAQGAVIPPNKEFMAVLGDQKSGTNIETPLSTMVEAFNQALAQNGGSGKTEINFLLPDRRKIAQYVLEGGRIMQTSTGKNPFELA